MTVSEFYTSFDRFSKILQTSALHLTKNMDDARDLYQETAYWALKKRNEITTGTNIKNHLVNLMTKLANKPS